MARKKDPEREAARRQEMMTTCYRLLSSRSHQSMTLEAVAQELGGSKGQIAHYFPNKEALIAATMRGALELYSQMLVAVAMEEGVSLRQRMKNVIATALPDAEELKNRIAFLAEVWSFSKTSKEVEQALQQGYARMHDVTEQLLDVGVKEGWIKARHASQVLLPIAAMFDGLAIHGAHGNVDIEELRRQAEKTLSLLLGLS